jgi:hypothetical protein
MKVNETIKLIPFGDIHRDSDMFAHGHWKRFLDYAKAQPNAWFLGMGDFFDALSTSERLVFADDRLHDSTKTTVEEHYNGWIVKLAKELEFMKGRLLGLHGGNHYVQFRHGENSDQKLCRLLDTTFLGVSSFIRISIDEPFKRGCITTDIFSHHGKGSGKRTSGAFNSVEDMAAYADAEIYLMGHDHSRGVIPAKPRLRIGTTRGELRLRERTPWFGRTGSFLASYDPGHPSYNVDAGRGPCSLGWIEFEITLRKSGTKPRQYSLDIRGIA